MESGVITRAALGSIATLGTLYDARTDQFCPVKIHKTKHPKSPVTVLDIHTSSIEISRNESFSEKLSKLKVNGSLKLAVLAGICQLDGAGSYLSDNKTSARSVKQSIILSIKTKVEQLHLYDNAIQNKLACSMIKNGRATHLVEEVHWGANLVVTCTSENLENKDVSEISGKLKAKMEKLEMLKLGITKTGVGASYNSEETEQNIKFDIKIYGDVLPENLPTTLEACADFMSQPMKLLKNCNDGWGQPIAYKLYPLSSIISYMDSLHQTNIVLQNVDEAIVTNVVQLFEDSLEAQQRLNDLYQDACQFNCVEQKTITEIQNLKKEVATDTDKLRKHVSSVLVKVRSGEAQMDELNQIIRSFEDCNSSPSATDKKLRDWKKAYEAINFANVLRQNGVQYIGNGVSLDDVLLRDFGMNVYILMFRADANTKARSEWIHDKETFFKHLQSRKETDRFYAMDCGNNEASPMKTETRSCVMKVPPNTLKLQNLSHRFEHPTGSFDQKTFLSLLESMEMRREQLKKEISDYRNAEF